MAEPTRPSDGMHPLDVMAPIDAETRRSMLRYMLVARAIDDEASLLQNQGAVDLWLPCRGQEAAQVGSATAIGDEAVIFPSYREHAVAVQRGINGVELVAQWAGRTFCGWDPHRHRFFPYTLVLATQALHGVGYAIGRRLQNMPETVVIYIGDGATSEGDMSEAMNLAAVESAAVLFICQNNGWAISKPSHEQMATSIADRANGFGLRSWSVAADDPDDTYLACLTARRYVEAEQAPALIELRTTRVRGHTTSDPHRTYRDPSELAIAEANDPVAAYREKLYTAGVVDEAWLDAVKAEAGLARRGLLEAFAS